MKKFFLFLFACCLLPIAYCFSQGTWTQKADFGGVPRAGAMGFAVGNKGYIGTGRSSVFFNDIWEYDPTSNQWIQKGNFPGTPRMYATGFSIGTKGYLATGDTTSGASYMNDFWEYNPSNDTWTQLTFPGIARAPGVGFSIGLKGYFGTGNDLSDFPTQDWWEFNPSGNTWTQKANMPLRRCSASGFSAGTKGYVGTGQDSSINTKTFWEYNPSANSWIQKPDFGGTARRHAVGFSIGLNGYMGTGSFTKDFWEFDPNGNAVNETELENLISVYPSPSADGKFTVSGLQFKVKIIDIYNVSGKLVYHSTVNRKQETVNLSEGSGIYFIHFSTKKRRLAKEIEDEKQK